MLSVVDFDFWSLIDGAILCSPSCYLKICDKFFLVCLNITGLQSYYHVMKTECIKR